VYAAGHNVAPFRLAPTFEPRAGGAAAESGLFDLSCHD
jgi:hypothetical protein